MDLQEALELAAKIASGSYDERDLNGFLGFLDAADPDRLNQVLDAYQRALDQQESYRLHTNPDFMDRLRAMRPETTMHPVSERIFSETPVVEMNPAIAAPRRASMIRRFSVAAIIILVFSASTYFYFQNKPGKQNPIAQSAPIPKDVPAPKTNRATITLANGNHIYLDSVANGTLATQGATQIIKTAAGQIAYDVNPKSARSEISYNTLTNPRGSRAITMTLSDGSKVWLNAGSSLTYPVAFTGHERNVEITGEAYFEVTHNPNMPFTVKKLHDDASIQVLGTHFNVNAYDDESAMRVTLLEGSVKVTKGNNKLLIKPGQQAAVMNNEIKLAGDVDIDAVMAWKDGKFQFGDAADIKTIMRQVSRWYDVDVVYEGNITGSIGGSISRDVNASQLFKMLETTGAVKFKIEGNKVTVMPAAP